MGLINKIKKAEKKMDAKSWLKGYTIKKWVFNIPIIIMILLTLLVWAEYDFADIKEPHIYQECKDAEVCRNVFYDVCNPKSINFRGGAKICDQVSSEVYSQENLLRGETLGQKPSWLADSLSSLIAPLFILAFAFNHYKYNRKRKEEC